MNAIILLCTVSSFFIKVIVHSSLPQLIYYIHLSFKLEFGESYIGESYVYRRHYNI